MIDTKAQLISLLDSLKEQIMAFIDEGNLDGADLFLQQYIKFAPETADRYSLEAMIRLEAGDAAAAQTALEEGLKRQPLSFDLLYNHGLLMEKQEKFLEAYYSYMKARYIAGQEGQQTDVAAALRRLVPHIRGTVNSADDRISIAVRAGDITLTVSTDKDLLLRRKELLAGIESHIDRRCRTVLEIGFQDGIIGKTLNYLGYDVTAVDRSNKMILNAIAREWHDNLLHPEQRVVKLYQEPVDLAWLKQIPQFDVIIAAGSDNRAAFAAGQDDSRALIRTLLSKADQQLFVSADEDGGRGFAQDELLLAATENGFEAELIAGGAAGGPQLWLIDKQAASEPFSLPRGAEIVGSLSTIFEVELAKCVDVYGAGFSDDWHHFTVVLKEYEQNPELVYEGSALNSYYDSFQPRNLEEGLYGRRGPAPILRAGWIGLPWYFDRRQKVVFQSQAGHTRPGGNHFFGPNSQEFGDGEFKRLTRLYDLLKTEGYQPELFSDGYISGYLLLSDEDYRFVVTEGQHRIACLAVLGCERLRCRFTLQPQYPQLVALEEAKQWPQVANKAFSRSQALKMFWRFFAPDVGRDRRKF